MNFSLKSLAEKKWFVPIVIIVLSIIVVSSFVTENTSSDAKSEKAQFEEICMAITGEEVKVMLTYDVKENNDLWQSKNGEKISGVAIICNSGDDPAVKLKIHEVARALFDIPSTRITVSGKN